MEKFRLHDLLHLSAEAGHISVNRNLYPKQRRTLLKEGFSVKILGSVDENPDQTRCKISWENAKPDTYAYYLLVKATKARPELLGLEKLNK